MDGGYGMDGGCQDGRDMFDRAKLYMRGQKKMEKINKFPSPTGISTMPPSPNYV